MDIFVDAKMVVQNQNYLLVLHQALTLGTPDAGSERSYIGQTARPV